MLTSTAPKRHNRAVQAYAVLCALTGVSGIMLSLWTHPVDKAERLAQAAHHFDQQSQQASLQPETRAYLRGVARDLKAQAAHVVPVDTKAAPADFRGVHFIKADAL